MIKLELTEDEIGMIYQLAAASNPQEPEWKIKLGELMLKLRPLLPKEKKNEG